MAKQSRLVARQAIALEEVQLVLVELVEKINEQSAEIIKLNRAMAALKKEVKVDEK